MEPSWELGVTAKLRADSTCRLTPRVAGRPARRPSQVSGEGVGVSGSVRDRESWVSGHREEGIWEPGVGCPGTGR